jgi:hypothetical protein
MADGGCHVDAVVRVVPGTRDEAGKLSNGTSASGKNFRTAAVTAEETDRRLEHDDRFPARPVARRWRGAAYHPELLGVPGVSASEPACWRCSPQGRRPWLRAFAREIGGGAGADILAR